MFLPVVLVVNGNTRVLALRTSATALELDGHATALKPPAAHLLFLGNNPARSRELAAVRERLTTLGYQDGVDDGVQQAVQGGFDQGYAVGAAAGWEAGSLYGGAAAARAALVACHERSAEVGATGTADIDTTAASGTLGDTTASAGSWAGGGGIQSVAATAVEGGESPDSARGRRLEASDGKGAATSRSLHELVEELRHAVFLGPDGPGVLDRADVLRRLRLAGAAGQAVADGLDDKSP